MNVGCVVKQEKLNFPCICNNMDIRSVEVFTGLSLSQKLFFEQMCKDMMQSTPVERKHKEKCVASLLIDCSAFNESPSH